MSEDKLKRIQELIKILNAAAKAYYVDGAEIMSNFEYDALYDELSQKYLDAGYQEIIDERQEMFEAGETTKLQ